MGTDPTPLREQGLSMTTARVIIAGPTAGKSTLRAALNVRGAPVLDTDDLMPLVRPGWRQDPQHQWPVPDGFTPSQVSGYFDEEMRMLAAFAVAWLEAHQHGFLVTNFWHKPLLEGLGRFRPSFAFFRSDPADLVSVDAARRGDKAIPASEAARWVEGWKNVGPSLFDEIFWLQEGDFLSNAVAFSHAWLDPMPPAFAYSFDAAPEVPV